MRTKSIQLFAMAVADGEGETFRLALTDAEDLHVRQLVSVAEIQRVGSGVKLHCLLFIGSQAGIGTNELQRLAALQ